MLSCFLTPYQQNRRIFRHQPRYGQFRISTDHIPAGIIYTYKRISLCPRHISHLPVRYQVVVLVEKRIIVRYREREILSVNRLLAVYILQ